MAGLLGIKWKEIYDFCISKGAIEKRRSSSHIILKHPSSIRPIVIPMYKEALSPRIIKNCLRGVGAENDDFLKYLGRV